MRLRLKRGERIVAVVPEPASGPGWGNQVVWVYIDGPSGIRFDCLQPSEMSEPMQILFAPGAAMHSALVDAVPWEREETVEDILREAAR